MSDDYAALLKIQSLSENVRRKVLVELTGKSDGYKIGVLQNAITAWNNRGAEMHIDWPEDLVEALRLYQNGRWLSGPDTEPLEFERFVSGWMAETGTRIQIGVCAPIAIKAALSLNPSVDSSPLTTFLTDWSSETAKGAYRFLCELRAGMSAETVSGKNDAAAKPDTAKPKLSKEAIALATLVDHPKWTNEQIADAVGCHVKTLSSKDWKKFRAARGTLADGRKNMPRGTKNKKTGDVEAWDEDR